MAERIHAEVNAVLQGQIPTPASLQQLRGCKPPLIAFTPYVIQRDPRWFQSPDDFKPERFLPGAPDIPRGVWMPFGTGPRVCIGQHFALL